MPRSLATIPLLLLLACGGEEPGDSVPDAQPTPEPDANSGFPDAWTGNCSTTEYTLGSITCWDTDLSTSVTLDDFVAAAADSTLRFEELPDDSCAIEIRFDGDACTEDQRWIPGATEGEMTSTGIASCAPAACAFGAGDDECAVGDHAATATVQIGVVLDVGDLILTFDGATGVCADLGYDIEEQFWRVPR